MSRLRAAIKDLAHSDRTKARLLAAFIMFALAICAVSVVATPAAATDGNITAATSYYGLTIMDWVFAGLAIVMLVLYAINRHPYELFAFIGLAALLVIMYVYGM
jgi:hypothetical protein